MEKATKAAPPSDVLRNAASIALEKSHQKAVPTLSVAHVVRVCFDIIEKYKNAGMTYPKIAEALSESIMHVHPGALETAYRAESEKRANRQSGPD
jgi:hypothetical protein